MLHKSVLALVLLVGISSFGNFASAQSLHDEYAQRSASAQDKETNRIISGLIAKAKRECIGGFKKETGKSRVIQSEVVVHPAEALGSIISYTLTLKTSNGYICSCDYDAMGVQSGPSCVR